MEEEATYQAVVLIPKGWGVPQHMTSVGSVEGSGGDSQSPRHILHKLPRRPPWFLGGLRHMYCFPRGQTASEVNGHKGRVLVRNIFGPAQSV